MQSTLGELARLVEGAIAERDAASAELEIRGANALADVQSGEITLIDSEQRLNALIESNAAAAVVPLDLNGDLTIPGHRRPRSASSV